jgi:HEAT repeat protein
LSPPPYLAWAFTAALQSPPGDYAFYRGLIFDEGKEAAAYLHGVIDGKNPNWLECQFARAILLRLEQPEKAAEFERHFFPYGARWQPWEKPETEAQPPKNVFLENPSDSIPFLVEQLFKQLPRKIPDPTVIGYHMSAPQGAALNLLRTIGGKDAARAAAIYLLTDSNPEKTFFTGQIRDYELGTDLLKLLPFSEKSPDAAWVLAEFSDWRAIAPLIAAFDYPPGISAYQDRRRSHPASALYAAQVLAKIGKPALFELQEAALGDNPKIVFGAIMTLGLMGEDALATLEMVFKRGGKLADCRTRVMRTVGGIKSPGTIPLLLKGLAGPDRQARAEAAWALTVNDSEASRQGLLQALSQPDNNAPIPLYNIAHALGQLKEMRAVPRLLPLLDHPDDKVRAIAADVLHQLTGEDLGTSPADWRKWWQEHRGGFEKP